MLQNAPTLAIVAVHTAENGPSKVHQVMNKIHRNIGLLRGDEGAAGHGQGAHRDAFEPARGSRHDRHARAPGRHLRVGARGRSRRQRRREPRAVSGARRLYALRRRLPPLLAGCISPRPCWLVTLARRKLTEKCIPPHYFPLSPLPPHNEVNVFTCYTVHTSH